MGSSICGFYSSSRDWQSRRQIVSIYINFIMLLSFSLSVYKSVVNYHLFISIHIGSVCCGYFTSNEMPFQTVDCSSKTHCLTGVWRNY